MGVAINLFLENNFSYFVCLSVCSSVCLFVKLFCLFRSDIHAVRFHSVFQSHAVTTTVLIPCSGLCLIDVQCIFSL